MKLVFFGCKELTDAAVVCLAKSLPLHLERLGISFSNCANISNEAVQTLAAELPVSLTELHTDFTYTSVAGGQICHTVYDFLSWFDELYRSMQQAIALPVPSSDDEDELCIQDARTNG